MTISQQNSLNTETILSDVSKIIVDVIGEEYLGDYVMTPETSFEELDLESIDIVVMAEKLKTFYGEKLTLDDWWEELQEKQNLEVRAGDLVEYIKKCLSEPEVA